MSRPSLQTGDTGNDVAYMQSRLNLKGYRISSDGVFGSKTFEAVIGFQKKNNLQPDGVCGPNTWNALESSDKQYSPDEMVDWSRVVELLPNFYKQRYQLSGAQCPSNPPGMSLRNIGDETTNCVQFTAWLVSNVFAGVKFSSQQWKKWMVSGDYTGSPPIVPNWGPRVALEWGVATQSPTNGPWLIQYFTKSGGHSLIVVKHDPETDKILTLESTDAYGVDGAGWAQIGNLKDHLNPGKNWTEKVTQTWTGRISSKVAVHCVSLNICSKSIDDWLSSQQ